MELHDLPIIDAHHHLWDLSPGPLHYPWLQDRDAKAHFLGDQGSLRRDYLPEHYRADARLHNVVGTVHVEAECDRRQQLDETRWLTRLHARHGLPSAIVAHSWLHTPDAPSILAQQAAFPLVRGIRSKPVTRNSPEAVLQDTCGSMQDPRWRSGLRLLVQFSLSWDLRVPTWHLEEAADVVRENPQLPVVLNHTGFPWDRSSKGLTMWRSGMRALARLDNCMCKLSCLCIPEGQWDYEGNRAIILETIDLFGPDRCMFASNFPVDGMQVDFDTMFNDYKRITDGFTAVERRSLFHDTAARFYRLD